MTRLATPETVLPTGVMPRGLSRVQAAVYIGVSPTMFDRMVKDLLMPKPVRVYSRTIWDIRKLDAAFAALDTEDNVDDPWGRMSA